MVTIYISALLILRNQRRKDGLSREETHRGRLENKHFLHQLWLSPEIWLQHETCALVVTLSLVPPHLCFVFLPPPLFCLDRI